MESRTEAEPGSPGQAGGVRWDTSRLRRHESDVANAAATPDSVVLSFGATTEAEVPGGTAVELLGRIRLELRTAQHLHDVLARMVSEAAARGKR